MEEEQAKALQAKKDEKKRKAEEKRWKEKEEEDWKAAQEKEEREREAAKKKSAPKKLEPTWRVWVEKAGRDQKCLSVQGGDDKERELWDGDLQAGEWFSLHFVLLILLFCRTLYDLCTAGSGLLSECQICGGQFGKSCKTKCLKTPSLAPLLIIHCTPAALLTDLYVLPEGELEMETDILEPSSKIVRMSEWAMGVTQAIQDHADALWEVSRQTAEQEKSAAQATIMAAVIKMGSSVSDFKKWVKALEGGEEDDDEEEEEEEDEDTSLIIEFYLKEKGKLTFIMVTIDKMQYKS